MMRIICEKTASDQGHFSHNASQSEFATGIWAKGEQEVRGVTYNPFGQADATVLGCIADFDGTLGGRHNFDNSRPVIVQFCFE